MRDDKTVILDDKRQITTDKLPAMCSRLNHTEFLDERKKIKYIWLDANKLSVSGMSAYVSDLHQQTLKIAQRIGWSHEFQHQYTEAIDAYKKAAIIRRQCQQHACIACQDSD